MLLSCLLAPETTCISLYKKYKLVAKELATAYYLNLLELEQHSMPQQGDCLWIFFL